MEALIEAIMHAADLELQKIMKAIEQRYASAYPNWEVIYLAVPKDPVRKKTELAQIIAHLEKEVI